MKLGRRLALIALLASSCTPKTNGPDPESVVTAYLTAVAAQDWSTAYSYLSSEDRAAIPPEGFPSRFTAITASPLGAALIKETRFTLVRQQAKRGHATVVVTVSEPDPKQAAAAVADAAGSATGSDFEFRWRSRLVTLPRVTREQVWQLVSEGGRWRIALKESGG